MTTPIPAPLSPEREAAKARVRAKVAADKAMPARERIYHLLCATYTHAEAEAMLAEVEANSPEIGRLRAALRDAADQVAEADDKVAELSVRAAELDRVRAENARLLAERHETNDALADITLARYVDADVLRVELASAQRQWEHWAREATALRERVAELEAERLREGRLAEQRHALLDLDLDSCCRPAGFVCPNACPAPELEAAA